MRAVIVTSTPVGLASYCLPALLRVPGLVVAGVLLNEGRPTRPWRRRWRKFVKAIKIGPLGAVNGVRIRKWYGEDLAAAMGPAEPIDVLAERHGIPVWRTPSLLAPESADLIRRADVDVGLSLGNGFIPKRLFAVPRLGMLNIHHELLPEFQGAQSVLWQIYHGSRTTGFTIHRIDDRIDTGDIVVRREVPIDLRPTLGQTVTATLADVWARSIDALAEVMADPDCAVAAARPQGPGRRYTTPSYWQFRRMRRQHRRLLEAAR